MLLYYSPGACSLAPHIVAREAWVPIELVRVDLATKTTERGENYLTINPGGSVPALLLDNGSLLTEAAVICQFIADLEPETMLMPAPGTIERYQALQWLNFAATELHKNFSPLWRRDTPVAMRMIAKDIIGSKLGFLNRHLEDRDYVLGDTFSAADAYVSTILSWAPVVKIDLSGWASLAAYVERVSGRPGVRAALAAEGLLGTEVA